MSVSIHGDCKLNVLSCFPINRYRRKQLSELLSEVELRSYRSVNGSIGWLGTNASLFCAFYLRWMQQRAPSHTVQDLIFQINSLKHLKKLGTGCHYKRPVPGKYDLSVLVFADASRKEDHGQLSFLSGILFGNLASGSVFHVISCSSRKSRRPVKSVASAETLAAGDAIDEGKLIVKAFNELLNLNMGLWIAVDSKDLF